MNQLRLLAVCSPHDCRFRAVCLPVIAAAAAILGVEKDSRLARKRPADIVRHDDFSLFEPGTLIFAVFFRLKEVLCCFLVPCAFCSALVPRTVTLRSQCASRLLFFFLFLFSRKQACAARRSLLRLARVAPRVRPLCAGQNAQVSAFPGKVKKKKKDEVAPSERLVRCSSAVCAFSRSGLSCA